MRSVAITAAIVVAGLLVWSFARRDVAPVAASGEMRVHTVAPVLPGTYGRILPTTRRPVDAKAAQNYKQTRLSAVDDFNTWVRHANVTSEQEARVLQLLADAQAIYDSAVDVRDELQRTADRMRDVRMAPEQKQKLNAARSKWLDANKRHDQEAMAEAEHAKSLLWKQTDDALEATAPEEERAAFTDSLQIDRDLDAQVFGAFTEFLTEQQIEDFRGDVGSVAGLLTISHAIMTNRLYLEAQERELAARQPR